MKTGKFMNLELAKLGMSHIRDFKIDPLEKEEAAPLINSINDHGFWGGVIATKRNGQYEVVAGHKRVYAAMEAGVKYAEIFVRDLEDDEMIRIYCTENITQRGEKSGLAMAGAVASAARWLIKAILKGDKNSISQICDIEKNGKCDIEHLQGNIISDKGLGSPLILSFYKGAMKENVVSHHLANIKASGDYARIVNEVAEEIEKEHAREVEELERKEKEAQAAQEEAEKAHATEEAEKAKQSAAKAQKAKEKAKTKHGETAATGKKATEAASKKKPTFDLTGVGKYLKTEHQIRTFRKVMEREAVKKHLPIERQQELAAMLADYANKHEVELTGQFIDDYTTALIKDVGSAQGKINKEEMAKIEAENERVKFKNLSHHFCRNLAGAFRSAKDMLDMKAKNPGLPFQITQELKDAVKFMQPKLNELASKLGL